MDEQMDQSPKNRIFDYEPVNCISNIPADQAKYAEQAAKEMGYKVKVNPVAKDDYGNLVKGFVALETTETSRDHASFWKRFRELKAENE
jgi:hypothetical protein